jgi:hypothetical protein
MKTEEGHEKNDTKGTTGWEGGGGGGALSWVTNSLY